MLRGRSLYRRNGRPGPLPARTGDRGSRANCLVAFPSIRLAGQNPPEARRLATRTSGILLGNQPAPEDREDIRLLLGSEFAPPGDRVPFLQAAPAARRGRVLRHEDGVVAHRRLLAVVRRVRRGKPLLDEDSAMLQDDLKPFLPKVFSFGVPEAEPAPQVGSLQPLEDLIQVAHGPSSPSHPTPATDNKIESPVGGK